MLNQGLVWLSHIAHQLYHHKRIIRLLVSSVIFNIPIDQYNSHETCIISQSHSYPAGPLLDKTKFSFGLAFLPQAEQFSARWPVRQWSLGACHLKPSAPKPPMSHYGQQPWTKLFISDSKSQPHTIILPPKHSLGNTLYDLFSFS